MDELQVMEDDRLYGVMACLVSMKALFQEVVNRRNERNLKEAEELSELIGEKVRVVDLSIPDDKASREVHKFPTEDFT